MSSSSSATSSPQCSICLESITIGGGRSMATLACGHLFHLDCIGSEFNFKGVMQCPNCRFVEVGDWLYAAGGFNESIENNSEMHPIRRNHQMRNEVFDIRPRLTRNHQPTVQESLSMMNRRLNERNSRELSARVRAPYHPYQRLTYFDSMPLGSRYMVGSTSQAHHQIRHRRNVLGDDVRNRQAVQRHQPSTSVAADVQANGPLMAQPAQSMDYYMSLLYGDEPELEFQFL